MTSKITLEDNLPLKVGHNVALCITRCLPFRGQMYENTHVFIYQTPLKLPNGAKLCGN